MLSRISRSLAFAAVVGLGSFGITSSAQAGDCYTNHYQSSCYYKTIVTYKTVLKPYTCLVTKYTSCGHPYQVEVVKYKRVRVPCTKRVLVCR